MSTSAAYFPPVAAGPESISASHGGRMKGGPSRRSGRFILAALGCCGPLYVREGSEELAVRCRKFSYCCIFHVTKEVGLLIPASVVATSLSCILAI